MKHFISLFSIIILSSCSSVKKTPISPKIVVDVAESKLSVVCDSTQTTCYETEIETSRKGTGLKKGSNKTPTGRFTVVKEPYHRYGPSLRLSGYQGYSRGILIHKDFKNGNGTSGCICPLDEYKMHKVFDLVQDNTPIEIY